MQRKFGLVFSILALIALTGTVSAQVYNVSLSSDQSLTAGNDSDATGNCLLYLDKVSDMEGALTVICRHDVENVAAAHIHRAAAGETGPVELNIFPDPTSPFKAEVMLNGQQMMDLVAGLYYVNVHSQQFPQGEIRGQIENPADKAVVFDLEGAQEVPPVTTDASGKCMGALNPMETQFNIACTHTAQTVNAAHIHRGAAGENGPPIFTLNAGTTIAASVTPMDFDGCPGFDEFVEDLRDEQLYVNVHTPDNPGGELRGQIPPAPRAIYFPQFGNGGAAGTVTTQLSDGFTSSIVVMNLSTTDDASGQVAFLDQDGDPLSVGLETMAASTRGGTLFQTGDQTSVMFDLQPLGSVTMTTDGIGELKVGSAEAISDGPISGVIRFSVPGIGIVGVGAAEPTMRAIAPARYDGVINTAIAVRNNETFPIEVTMQLVDNDGPPPGTVGSGDNPSVATASIPANGRVAMFIDQYFPDADTAGFVGTVVITSENGSFSAISLEQGEGPGLFTSLPTTPLVGP